ncbi:hypothetical protein [Nitrosospira briensis]|uniref:hypothetical protein n=1 Tax=Nitrosospira briensis TaxID=35799 RepID=UPI000944F47F|nr:hypothetical protein [Nitrosospira briensis]
MPRDAFNLAVVALNAAGVTPRVIEWIEFILSTKKVINKEITFLVDRDTLIRLPRAVDHNVTIRDFFITWAAP